MADKKLREPRAGTKVVSVGPDAKFWMMKFVPDFERALVHESASLQEHTDINEFQNVTVRAMLRTLLDSGMSVESLTEIVGQVLNDLDPIDAEWNSRLNKRRLALIDKQIQRSITPAEKLELARLTTAMRQHVDSEANLPIQGARALHKKLLEANVKDQGH